MNRLTGRNKGSAIAMSTVLALVLVLLGIAFVIISMYFGGGRETKNAVDAGALNVGKKVLDDEEVSIHLDGSPNDSFFADVSEDGTNHGKINLRNINRVWAKALLVAINADSAGAKAGTGGAHAQTALDTAKALSSGLFEKLTNPNRLYPFFQEIAQRNSVRMLGAGNTVQVSQTPNWMTSLMDRDPAKPAVESNILVPKGLLDSLNGIGYNALNGVVVDCSRTPKPAEVNGLKFLPGYLPMHANNSTFWNVPFKWNEKPHLVADSSFQAKMQPPNMLPEAWQTAIPNAFSVEGKVTKSDGPGQLAMSWVQANPRQTFTLAMPHSYIHIHLDDMESNWYYEPTGYPPVEMGLPTNQDYGYTTDQQSSVGAFGGIGCSSVTTSSVIVGTDVVGRGLDDIIFTNPDGDGIEQVEAAMLNRCAEMITDLTTNVTASDMHDAIGPTGSANGGKTYGELVAGDRDFYLYSEDGKTLTIRSKTEATISAPQWLKQMIISNPDDDADGIETKKVDDASMPGAIVIIPFTNINTTPIGVCPFGTGPDPVPFGFGTWEKDVWWTPGSGFNGCLGKVRVHRYTNVYSVGFCPYCI